jgi:hypothetical protein
LTEQTSRTSHGGTITYVTETLPNGKTTTYTVLPTTSTSYVPAPVSYTNSKGESVCETYVATPSGYETVTYISETTPSGYLTEIITPTSSGYSTIIEQSSTQEVDNHDVTFVAETYSNG